MVTCDACGRDFEVLFEWKTQVLCGRCWRMAVIMTATNARGDSNDDL